MFNLSPVSQNLFQEPAEHWRSLFFKYALSLFDEHNPPAVMCCNTQMQLVKQRKALFVRKHGKKVQLKKILSISKPLFKGNIGPWNRKY